MNSFAIELKSAGGGRLYEQIYDYIRNEIREGKLLYQEKLPSARSLAGYLQVSRSTVDAAYEQLVSEGYVESVPYKGYYVCRVEELYRLDAPQESGSVRREAPSEKQLVDFSPNAIDLEAFPFDTWRRITKGVLQDANKELFQLGSPQGDGALRTTISKYLHASRGVCCAPEQIVVGAGNDYLLMLLRKLLGENRSVAIENPTYRRAYLMFHSFGYRICTIEMDEAGMQVEKLRESQAELAYVMPSHQYPTGVVMPIGRRMELLKWAAQCESRYLIEDDYDSEFRYKGKPIPSLQASDRGGKVIYMGTFSKSIAPSIRVSYMVLPPRLLELYRSKYFFLASTVSRIDQAVLNVFIRDGYYERHLNKMRKIYKAKHDLLLLLLKSFEREFAIRGENAGLHLLLEKREAMTAADAAACEAYLIRKAQERGIRIYGMCETLAEGGETPEKETQKKPTLILGYAGLNQADITEGISRLQSSMYMED